MKTPDASVAKTVPDTMRHTAKVRRRSVLLSDWSRRVVGVDTSTPAFGSHDRSFSLYRDERGTA